MTIEKHKHFTYRDCDRTVKISNHYAIDKIPDECPMCHAKISPELHYSITMNSGSKLQVAFRCNFGECGNMFIGTYEGGKLVRTGPVYYSDRLFEEEINTMSPLFVKIYNQARHAETLEMDEISGVGYRKALEFLVKDFLIKIKQLDEHTIRNKFLGKCISEDIENQRIKDMAKRAAWLGNDEAHYFRKWEDKDIRDLKRLIEATMHFITMELIADKYVKEMPE